MGYLGKELKDADKMERERGRTVEIIAVQSDSFEKIIYRYLSEIETDDEEHKNKKTTNVGVTLICRPSARGFV